MSENSRVDDQCGTCGRDIDGHDRNVRFTLPDPVLDTEDQDRAPGSWLSHEDASLSVMMQIPEVGAFLRALLPVSLTGGYSVTYGVWVGVDPDDLQRASAIWWKPEYSDLRIEGRLANAVQPWGLLGAPVALEVLNPEQTPYCVRSDDARLSGVLGDQWDHDLVLSVLA